MQTLKKLFEIINKQTKVKLLILLVAIVFGAALEMVALALVSPFIYILLDSSIIYTNPLINWFFELLGFASVSAFLALLAFLLAAVYFFRGFYMYVLNRTKFRFLARRQVAMSERLLDKLLGFSYIYHTKHNLAELQQAVNGDVAQLFLVISACLRFATDFFVVLSILLFLVISSPVMTFFVVALAFICVLVYLRIFRGRVRAAGAISRAANVEMGKAVNQAFGGVKEVKLLRREKYFRNVFKVSSDAFVEANTLYRSLEIVPKLSVETVCFGGAFILLGLFIASGVDISGLVPQLSLFVVAAFRLLPALSRLVTYVNLILYNRVSIDAVYRSLFEEADIQLPGLPDNDLACERNVKGDCIEVRNLAFAYPSGEPVLDDVSFEIPEKKSVAFVGLSGAGKTTLADLILGILSPISGGVFFQGKSIHHNFDEWTKLLGYIPQQIYLLDETIRENVAFGIDKTEIDDAKVWRALELAQLKEFVKGMPNGLDTVTGDRGIRLSGGQRQRIGIARAMYEDPPILILDEATSSLDSETEKAVMDAVLGFHGNKTMIIVAHRLSTIEHCDIVYRVENRGVTRER